MRRALATGAFAVAALLGCRPERVPVPPSAMPTGPDGQAIASVERVPLDVTPHGTATVDARVDLPDSGTRVDEPPSLTWSPGTGHLSLAVDNDIAWIGESGARVVARETVHPLPPLDVALVQAPSNSRLFGGRAHAGGAMFTFFTESIGHAEQRGHVRSQRVLASYTRTADGGFVLTGGIGMPSHGVAEAVLDDGVILSTYRALPTLGLGGAPTVLEPGTWIFTIDGRIRPVTERVFSGLAVDGERVWGIERRGRRHALVGVRRDGREFFRVDIPSAYELRAYAELVCVVDFEATQRRSDFGSRARVHRCFDLSGRPASPRRIPRDHVHALASGWTLVRSEERLSAHDAGGALVWSHALPPGASEPAVTAGGRVCVVWRPGPEPDEGRLRCWGGLAP